MGSLASSTGGIGQATPGELRAGTRTMSGSEAESLVMLEVSITRLCVPSAQHAIGCEARQPRSPFSRSAG